MPRVYLIIHGAGQGRAQAAGDAYMRALAVNPQYAEARLNLAALYHEHIMLEQAVEAYRAVLGMPQKQYPHIAHGPPAATCVKISGRQPQ